MPDRVLLATEGLWLRWERFCMFFVLFGQGPNRSKFESEGKFMFIKSDWCINNVVINVNVNVNVNPMLKLRRCSLQLIWKSKNALGVVVKEWLARVVGFSYIYEVTTVVLHG